MAMTASGGEDYELALVGSREALTALASRHRIAIVGEIVAGSGVRTIDAEGNEIALPSSGFDHLRGRSS